MTDPRAFRMSLGHQLVAIVALLLLPTVHADEAIAMPAITGDEVPAPQGDPGMILARLPSLRRLVGETTVYRGILTLAGVPVPVGTATLSVNEGDNGSGQSLLLLATAQGGALGYSITAEARSVLELPACLPREFITTEQGAETDGKRLEFGDHQVRYLKLKHCRDPDCENPAHMVGARARFLPPRTRAPAQHCSGCNNPEHFTWQVRYIHDIDGGFLDVLTALFASRTGDFDPGAVFVVPVVQDRDRWHVVVRVGDREEVTVDAGTFTCVHVRIRPVNVGDPKRQDKFNALFGMTGKLQAWVDTKTHVPVRISGVLPFAFLELDCDVRLVSHQGGASADPAEKAALPGPVELPEKPPVATESAHDLPGEAPQVR